MYNNLLRIIINLKLCDEHYLHFNALPCIIKCRGVCVSSLDKVFRGFLIIGLVMLVGRIVTAICRQYEIAFTTFFTDYHIVSLLILAIGIFGTEMKNYQKKKGRR